MYKKTTLFFVLCYPLLQHGEDLRPWLEIKPSYFFFSQAPMNAIYDHGGFEVQGSISLALCDYLYFYTSLGYRQAWGNALSSLEETSLIVVPFDIGLKPIYNFCEKFNYFVGIGPRFFYFHQRNNSLYVDSSINGGGIGFFINTGFNVKLVDSMLLGIFGEYSYENGKKSSNISDVFSKRVQIGGFAFGISLGYEF